MLAPDRVILLGASRDPHSVGNSVLRNLEKGAACFTIYAVGRSRVEVAGGFWCAGLEDVPEGPGLGIIALPAKLVPRAVRQLAEKGISLAVVISAGLGSDTDLGRQMLKAAKEAGIRLIGPNCLGLILPHHQLNGSFAAGDPQPGNLALLSQSGAIATAVIDWAQAREIGFSGIVSAGDMAQVGMGELLELFAADERSHVIGVYLEGLNDAEHFLRAAKAATVKKPVIALKAGRSVAAGQAALSHTGALAGSWAVYRAALREAGIILVDTLDELFDAAAILLGPIRANGAQLGIVTNGGGAGILAVDALAGKSAQLAKISPATICELDAVLPAGWSRANPVDMIGDADADRYGAGLRAMLADEGCDAILVMNCPTALLAPAEAANAAAQVVEAARAENNLKPVIGCWLGPANFAAAAPVLNRAGIPVFLTPADGVRGFDTMLRADAALRASHYEPIDTVPAYKAARAKKIIAAARKDGRSLLTEIEGKDLLALFDIPVVPTRFARTPQQAADCCEGLEPPYVLKIVSPDIVHKSDFGGVTIGLLTPHDVRRAASVMAGQIGRAFPDARTTGFAVQPMIRRKASHELFAGLAQDATFGPVVLFGAGGTAIEVLDDKAIVLAPVSHAQALAAIEQTRIARLLRGYRHVPPANCDAIAAVLQALSILAQALPEIGEIDINPLLADAEGVIALDARIVLRPNKPPSL